MRITFVLNHVNLNGGIRVTAIYAERLKRRGHDVVVVTRPRPVASLKNKVKSLVIFRGREIVHSEIGREILNRLAVELGDNVLVESPPRQEGNTMVQILAPKKEVAVKPKAQPKKEDGKKAEAKAEAKKAASEPKKPARAAAKSE